MIVRILGEGQLALDDDDAARLQSLDSDLEAAVERSDQAAPAPTGLMKGIGIDNAHMAFDSDCFSQAIASTRRYLPDCTRLAATTAVDPPTEPAVCTRINGLPVAPTASAMNSSGIMTPSKKSGALPTTTASMSFMVDPESANALSMASRTRPFIETSWRLATYFVWPVPSTAANWPAMIISLPARRRDSVATPGRWSRARAPGLRSRRKYVVPQSRCAPTRRRTSGWPPVHRRTG